MDILVELPDGSLVRKRREELQPDDLIVFDGPDAFAGDEDLHKMPEDEIAAAGGLEAWRRLKLDEIESGGSVCAPGAVAGPDEQEHSSAHKPDKVVT